jgi:hypothetical protein
VSPEKTTLQITEESTENTRPTPKKVYRQPVLSIYGRIERNTGGGSGMAKESFAMETFRHA